MLTKSEQFLRKEPLFLAEQEQRGKGSVLLIPPQVQLFDHWLSGGGAEIKQLPPGLHSRVKINVCVSVAAWRALNMGIPIPNLSLVCGWLHPVGLSAVHGPLSDRVICVPVHISASPLMQKQEDPCPVRFLK